MVYLPFIPLLLGIKMNETETAKIKGELYCGATELVELAVKKRKEDEEEKDE